MITTPPKDWKDKEAWNRYFDAQLFAGRTPSYPDFVILRFLSFSQKKGGRIWFPGCGLDPYPRKPDAVLELPQDVKPDPGPFAVLAGLKEKHGR